MMIAGLVMLMTPFPPKKKLGFTLKTINIDFYEMSAKVNIEIMMAKTEFLPDFNISDSN